MEKKTKACTRCKQSKPLFDFSDHSKMLDGKQSQCKTCFAERARLSRVGKPCVTCGGAKESGVPRGARLCFGCAATCSECGLRPRAKQHRRCKQCIAAADKARKYGEKARLKERVTRIASKYKVPRDEAARLACATHCAACEKLFSRLGEAHVDHCHVTGVVRGVLCFNCNAALGHVNDSVSRLLDLVKYINRSQATDES